MTFLHFDVYKYLHRGLESVRILGVDVDETAVGREHARGLFSHACQSRRRGGSTGARQTKGGGMEEMVVWLRD